jgi:hypothetical protein
MVLWMLGSPERVDELARKIDLRLESPDQVVEYLRFWCRAALRHTEQLVEGAIDFTWIPGVRDNPDLRTQADRAGRLAQWIDVGSGASGVDTAEVTVLSQRMFHLRWLQVRVDGHVDEIDRVELARDVPVVYVMP